MKSKKDKKQDQKYLRALADYQNLLRRTAKEKEEFVKFANEDLVVKLLTVLDNLEKAKENIKDQGIEIVYNDLWKVLKEQGLEKIEITKEEVFDPNKMECIEAEEGGQSLEEIRAGYMLRGKLIRVARVKVVK